MNHEDPLAHSRFNRSPARQADLLQRAEALIQQRNARMRPVSRSSTNEIPAPTVEPDPEKQLTTSMAAELARRLSRRDQSGGDSGPDVD